MRAGSWDKLFIFLALAVFSLVGTVHDTTEDLHNHEHTIIIAAFRKVFLDTSSIFISFWWQMTGLYSYKFKRL